MIATFYDPKRFVLGLVVLLSLVLVSTSLASQVLPGKGVTVKPARANWNTGYFQEAIVRAGLKELGYKVKKPKELQNALFYQSLALGDVDYWVNGWFPMHKEQMPANFNDKAEIIGYVAKAGGLQGYLATKSAVDKYNIKTLDDFKRPEVKAAFDRNGDGKADLVACPPGWGCEKTITYHFETYEMDDHFNAIKAGYVPSMADAFASHKNGQPILFYTWAPNWTIYKLKPGQDVMWIDVPELRPRPVEMEAKDQMVISGLKGAVNDPAVLGFVAADIRAVANKEFMAKNPAAATFLKLFTMPLDDINEQNARMEDGEKSQKHIERHAQEWIKGNRAQWDRWLSAARQAAK